MDKMEWFSGDGLMRGHSGDAREGLPGAAHDTVQGHNGILNRALYELLKFEIGQKLPADTWIETCLNIEHPEKPGYILRRPMDFENDEAQDNYAAVYAGCALHGITTLPRRIYSELSERGGFQDHKGAWAARHLRQGGDIACCQLSCGWTPFIWLWAWFLIGVLVNAFSGVPRDRNHISDARLTLVRLLGVKHAIAMHTPWKWIAASFWPVFWIWQWRTGKKYGSIWQPVALYDAAQPTHPNVRMALHLMGEKSD